MAERIVKNQLPAPDHPLYQFSFFEPVQWTEGERQIWRARERLTPSEWAAKYVNVVGGSMPGPWRNEAVPYLVKPMDTYALPHVRELVICAVAQSGKTRAAYNCLFWSLDNDPGPAMTVMSGQGPLNKFYADFLIPTFRESERLAALLSDNPDDTAKKRIKLKTGVPLYPAWATSAAALATFGIRYMIFDETDKYPPTVGDETDPITLGEKRQRVFERRGGYKRIKISTPTRDSGYIWKALLNCHQIWAYDVVCPTCSKSQRMHIDQLRIPDDITPEELAITRAARYECQHCADLWDERAREKAIRAGGWVAPKGADLPRPEKVGFHFPAWIVLDVSLTEIAEKWLKAKDNRAAEIDFYNDVLAENFEDNFSERKEDRVLALRDERPAGVLPGLDAAGREQIATLIMAIDTQDRGFYYEVRAFGFGQEMETWGIRCGYVETFGGLEQILSAAYIDPRGITYRISAGGIDTGGHRTSDVYDWCRLHPGMMAIKGQQRQTTPYRVTLLDRYPGTGKLMPGSIRLWNIDTNFYKNQLNQKLDIAPADPGAWHLNREYTEDYARQMCTEYRDERDLWQCPSGKPNHFWDVSTYGLAVADVMGVRFMPRPETQTKPQPPEPLQTAESTPEADRPRRRPSWFNRR